MLEQRNKMGAVAQYFYLLSRTNILFLLCLILILLKQNNAISAEVAPLASTQDLLNLSFEDLFSVPITSTSYFPETYLDVASSVSVISRQDWQKRGAQRLSDAYQNLPSVISLPNFLGQDSVRIRGYALSDARGVATLWDGVSINTFNLGTANVDRPNIQLNTLDSIEVTRGPGSALYGADAFHGVVALKSFESNKDVNNVMARIGSTGFYSAGYNGSHKVGSDSRLNISLSSSGQPDQNFKYNNSGGVGEREYNYKSTTFVTKFNSNPDTNWLYKVGYSYDNNDSNNFQGGNANGFVPNNDVASTYTDFSMLKADVQYKISEDSDVSLETYSWEQNKVYERPVNATRNARITGKETRDSIQLVYRDKNLAGNTELTVALGQRQDHIVNQHRKIFSSTTTFVDSSVPFSGVKRTINSFFIDGKTNITDSRWIYRYGFRLDGYSDFGTQFTPRLGVIYKLNKQAVLKALYGHAFRAPTAVEVGGSPFINGDPNIQPEELDTYELVYLRQNKTSKLEWVLFHNELVNGIRNIAGTFTNIADSESNGIELTYNTQIKDWLIESSASYVKGKDITNNADYKAFPKYMLNLGVGYQFNKGWSAYVNNRVHLGAYDTTKTTASELKDYWRMDFNITKSFKEKMQIFLNIRNVFDRKNYLPSLVDQGGGIPEYGISVDVGIRYYI